MTPIEIRSVDGTPLDAVEHPSTAGPPQGTVVLAHGITVDMDEGGMFVRLADRLAAAGFTAVRFSFRGHGRSGGTQRGVTIAGELLDLQAVVDHVGGAYGTPLAIVAASFGAVSTTLSLPYLHQVSEIVLWNPVLDLERTFVAPELPWGLENFGPEHQAQMRSRGFLLVDGEFELGRVLFEEFRSYRTYDAFVADSRPTLVIHGTRDTYVSFAIARAAAEERGCDFHPVRDSDHGFDTPAREDEAIETTVGWLLRRREG